MARETQDSRRGGPERGSIKRVLRLHLARVVPERRNPVQYQGKLKHMDEVRLGRWPAHEERRFSFTINFPSRGRPSSSTTGDSAYQGSGARTAFVWRAAEAQ